MPKTTKAKKVSSEAVAVEKTKITTKSIGQKLANWTRNNILPFVAVIALAGLAVRGLAEYLPVLSQNARLGASIVVVAFLLIVAIGADND